MELIFCVLALVFGYILPFKQIKHRLKCKEEVDATIISIERTNLRVDGYEMFNPKCSYYYNGREYTSVVKWYEDEEDFKEGDHAKIKICSSNPELAYKKGTFDGTIIKMPMAVCSIFFMIGLLAFLHNNGYVDMEQVYNKIYEKFSNEVKVEKAATKPNDNTNVNKEDEKYGSDMSNDLCDAAKEYIAKSELHEEIEGITFYLPIDYDIRVSGIDENSYGHRTSDSAVHIKFRENKGFIKDAMGEHERRLQRVTVLSDITEYTYNNNVFKHVKIRNEEDKYVDMVYSANSKRSICIEVESAWGCENIVKDLVSSFKY